MLLQQNHLPPLASHSKMAANLLARRPIIILISVCLVITFFILQSSFRLTPLPSPSTYFAGTSEPCSIDDTKNHTLGVSPSSQNLGCSDSSLTLTRIQFEKIFVVGLPSRTDRRDGMVLGAALSDIDIEFIDGVLGQNVIDKAVPSSPSHGRLADPSIGSWRAHINAIQE